VIGSPNGIRTTHTGSLPRPDDLVLLLYAEVAGEPVDEPALQQQVRAAVAESVRKLMRAYFPGEATGNDAWRYQYQSSDGARGVGISCRANEGGYHNAMVEFVHFATDKRLTESLGAR